MALTVEAGRPSKMHPQWGGLVMATWGEDYGGPLRNDQVEHVARYVANWESTALQQTQAEDPWIPFQDTTSRVAIEDVYRDEGSEPAAPAEPRPPEELFVSMACAGCHNLELPQTDENRGPVGPNIGNLAENAAQRIEESLRRRLCPHEHRQSERLHRGRIPCRRDAAELRAADDRRGNQRHGRLVAGPESIGDAVGGNQTRNQGHLSIGRCPFCVKAPCERTPCVSHL